MRQKSIPTIKRTAAAPRVAGISPPKTDSSLILYTALGDMESDPDAPAALVARAVRLIADNPSVRISTLAATETLHAIGRLMNEMDGSKLLEDG